MLDFQPAYCPQCAEPLRGNSKGVNNYCRQCNLEAVLIDGNVVFRSGDSSIKLNIPANPNDNLTPPDASGYQMLNAFIGFCVWVGATYLILKFFTNAKEEQPPIDTGPTFNYRVDAVLPKNTPTPFVSYDAEYEKQKFLKEREQGLNNIDDWKEVSDYFAERDKLIKDIDKH